MKYSITLLLLGLFSTVAFAEQYTPMKVKWDRPYTRTDGTQVQPDEPIFYMLWGTINAGQDDSERLIGAAINGIEFVHLIDKNRTGLAGGTVNYRVKACDKYPPEGDPKPENCSESSNIEATKITLLTVTELPPPETQWPPFTAPYLNRIEHVEPPPGWTPPQRPPGWKPPQRPPGVPPQAPPPETGVEGALGF